MCGILALLLADPNALACPELYDALHNLQHRGQDAAGIVTCGPRGRLYQCKGNGMVRDVFHDSQLLGLMGNMGLGHLRYPTAGSSANSEAQPFYVNSPYGIVFAHNGNLVNAPALREYLDDVVHRHINTDSDSELLLNIFADQLQQTGKRRINEEDLFTATKAIFERCKGGYACVAMIAGFGLIAFRDPNGIRPVVLGERQGQHGKDYMFASESVALTQQGYKTFYDIGPGQVVIIPKNSKPVARQVGPYLSYTPDIFEYVYFARPDTVLDGISVYHARTSMGDMLAKAVLKQLGVSKITNEIDVVIPVPDTATVAAINVAQRLGVHFSEGFVKNRYVGRTFIMPSSSSRKKYVRRKLNVMQSEFQNKSVLIVDDSIVRGTTSREIVQMAREAGAKRVFFASCSPPIRFAHIYGIDLADMKELVGHNRSEDEIAREIGADMTIYQSLDDLISACRLNPKVTAFEVGVFSGNYITGMERNYLDHLDEVRQRNRDMKGIENGEKQAQVDIALHNEGDHPRLR